jgi:RNA-directed DNA polymerase
MNPHDRVATGLALSMLAGPWSHSATLSRALVALGRTRPPKWLVELVDQVHAAYRDAPVDRPRELAGYLQACPAWAKAWKHRRTPQIVVWTAEPTRIVRRKWPVAELHDHAALARLLDLDQGELGWFADLRSQARQSPQRLQHYRWTVHRRPDGIRLVAAPKPRLKEIQRRLLAHVLQPIALHDAAHGGVRGRSVRTTVTPHAGAAVLVRADLESFFMSIAGGRIWNLLHLAGLPESVAYTLTGLMTTVVPEWVIAANAEHLDPVSRARLRAPHLPTGAPTSPALANLLCYSLDRRLAGLAERFDATYTRYVDDLVFSGGPELEARSRRFLHFIDMIARAEGFAVNSRKSLVMSQSGRQALLGTVINDHPTLARPERDALRAILHNCETRGWRTQTRGQTNFADHLRGRIAWAGGIDPKLGDQLAAAYRRIDWS